MVANKAAFKVPQPVAFVLRKRTGRHLCWCSSHIMYLPSVELVPTQYTEQNITWRKTYCLHITYFLLCHMVSY